MKVYGAFFADVSSGEGSRCYHTTRLDTYGCGYSHNCAYCYARAMLEFRNNWHPGNPHVADIAKIRKVVQNMEPGTVVRLGGMTDCFQECEKEHQVTRHTIEAMNKRGIHQLIVTKSDLVAEYMDMRKKELLEPILKKFKEVSVCEDVYSHWNVWQQTVNVNPNDCCNLRGV